MGPIRCHGPPVSEKKFFVPSGTDAVSLVAMRGPVPVVVAPAGRPHDPWLPRLTPPLKIGRAQLQSRAALGGRPFVCPTALRGLLRGQVARYGRARNVCA